MSQTDAKLNALLDELEDAGALADKDAVLAAFSDWAEADGRALYPHQEEAALAIAAREHVIAATPTGTGKSMIGVAAHMFALAAEQRSIYTAPLKALVSEKFFDLVELFGAKNVGMITGDISLNADAPIICATAEILANEALRCGRETDYGVVVVDEFHYYADPQRGWAWQVPLLVMEKAQFVLLSATLGDTGFFERELQRRTGRAVALVAGAERPVPLEFNYLVEPVERAVELALQKGRFPIYLVHFAQAEAYARAQVLAGLKIAPESTRKMARAAISGEYFGRGFGQKLKALLREGIGIHHAGMLPRYRRLVERLAQQGALAVICGTDTLGVGINVPIRTVMLTQLVKFDGERERQLSAREFHQIAGRAGRAGYDTVGFVDVLAPEHEVENAKIEAANAGRAKKKKKRKPEAGKVSWTRATFERLENATPEALTARFGIDHSMVLNVLAGQSEGGVDAAAQLLWLATNNHAALRSGDHWSKEASQWLMALGHVYASLLQAGVIERVNPSLSAPPPAFAPMPRARDSQIRVAGQLPEQFALNQALSPFALAALDLLDREADTYALDVVSVIESIVQGARPLLLAQRNSERARIINALKDQGVEYEERMRIIEDVRWPEPLAEVLLPAFNTYRQTNPWLLGLELEPKSVVRYMVEHAMTFSELISAFELERSEGVILRYLTDAYRSLSQIVSEQYRDETLQNIIEWLEETVRGVDSSLLQEWEALEAAASGRLAEPSDPAGGGSERRFGADEDGIVSWPVQQIAATTALQNRVFRLVELIAQDQFERLGKLALAGIDANGAPFTWDSEAWDEALGRMWDQVQWLEIGNSARSSQYFEINYQPDALSLAGLINEQAAAQLLEEGNYWLVSQVLQDDEDTRAWRLQVLIDVNASDRAYRQACQAALAEGRDLPRIDQVAPELIVLGLVSL